MICERCAKGDHCGSTDCMCQHKRPGYGQTARSIDEIVSDVLRKYVYVAIPVVKRPYVSVNVVECFWCGKRVNLTPKGRVMRYHKDNRETKYGKWGLRCPGSGKAPE